MKRLKNRRQSPPNGFLYTQRETGWQNWKVEPASQWDFYLCARAIQAHRKANPSFRLNTSLPAIEEELDVVTSARVAAIPGAESYLMDVGSAQPSFHQAPTATLVSQVAAAVGAVKAGKDILFDWEESGQPPVAQEVANRRASICVDCPQNGQGGLSRYFTIPAAAMIKARFEKLHEKKMATPSDAQLGICEACLCPLKLKVWTPLDFILKHMEDNVRSKLDGRCWITSEEAA